VVAQIPAPEFGLFVKPCRLTTAMRLRLKIVQYPDGPTFSDEEIDQMRADQAGTTGNERAP
jgi:hypothetical protein